MLYSLGKRITDILFFQMDFRIGDIKSQVKHFLNSDFQKLLIAGCILIWISLQELNDNKPVGGIKTNCKDQVLFI